MSMEEVNQRFPLTKYKAWRSTRESAGLSTAGGVTASSKPAAAASLKDLDMSPTERNLSVDVVSVDAAAPKESHGDTRGVEGPTPAAAAQSPVPTASEKPVEEASGASKPQSRPDGRAADQASESRPTESSTGPSSSPAETRSPHEHENHEDDDDDDDDHHIQTALPPELLSTPGDACAICLDTIEEDDDVRGLTCGHAFHAGCLDPWLTNRRACCPLCKADYYIPKPRPEGEAAAAEASRSGRRGGGGNNGSGQNNTRVITSFSTTAVWMVRRGDNENNSNSNNNNGGRSTTRSFRPGRGPDSAREGVLHSPNRLQLLNRGRRHRQRQDSLQGAPGSLPGDEEGSRRGHRWYGRFSLRNQQPRTSNSTVLPRSVTPPPPSPAPPPPAAMTMTTTGGDVEPQNGGGGGGGGWRDQIGSRIRFNIRPSFLGRRGGDDATTTTTEPSAGTGGPTPRQLESGG